MSRLLIVFACAGAGPILPLASVGYTSLVKLAIPVLGMWVFFLLMRLAEAFKLGSIVRTAWSFGFPGASAAKRAHQAIYAITPECICLTMPRCWRC